MFDIQFRSFSFSLYLFSILSRDMISDYFPIKLFYKVGNNVYIFCVFSIAQTRQWISKLSIVHSKIFFARFLFFLRLLFLQFLLTSFLNLF